MSLKQLFNWRGRGSLGKIPLRVEPERPLDEGTEWVVDCSTETVDSSLLTLYTRMTTIVVMNISTVNYE